MTDASNGAADLSDRVRRLERRLARERAARLAAEDIAEAKTAQLYAAVQRAEAVNAELETFVYTVSHDLKNPLLAITGYASLLQGNVETGDHEETASFLERTKVSVAYMQRLIGEVLQLSRVGRVDTEPEEVALDELVDELIGETAAAHPEAALSRGSLPALWCNPTRLRQVLTNLVANSVIHGQRADVSITITAESLRDGGVLILVRDDGTGIPSDAHDRIFGVFEQLDATAPGTGMGLAITRRAVETNGGTIAVEDRPMGEGAGFVLRFPADRVLTS